MRYKIIAVEYEISAQPASESLKFSVPEDVGRLMGIDDGSGVYLVIRDSNQQVIFQGDAQLNSGKEIYGLGVRAALPGQQLRVEVRRK